MDLSVEPSRNPCLILHPPRESDRRRHGRIRTEEVTCSIGDVVDLSASGMRVERKGRQVIHEGETITLTLKYDQYALPIKAEVVRLEKVGFRRYVLGMQFEELSDEIKAKLTHMARIASQQRVLPT